MLRLITVLIALYTSHAWGNSSIPFRVVTEIAEPHQYFKDDKLVGLNIDMVRKGLALAGYDDVYIEVYPWARSYQIATLEKNVLIFSMVQTTERVPLFHWIAKLQQRQLNFYALKARNLSQKVTSIEDIKNYVTVVGRNDMSYKYLIDAGFEPGKNLMVMGEIGLNYPALLMEEKIDFVIGTQISLDHLMDVQGLPPGTLQKVLPLKGEYSSFYLAASKGTDTRLVERLTNAFKKVPTLAE